MVTPARNAIFLLRAASAIALSKQADQPAANSCSGLVPMRADPGVESLTSRRPSELREAPFSRPPVVSVLAVCRTLAAELIMRSRIVFLNKRQVRTLVDAPTFACTN